MLRIKEDKIDKLKDFGFEKYHYRENHDYYMYPQIEDNAIYVFIETGEIMVNKFYDRHLEIIYDLIKADMVERI